MTVQSCTRRISEAMLWVHWERKVRAKGNRSVASAAPSFRRYTPTSKRRSSGTPAFGRAVTASRRLFYGTSERVPFRSGRTRIWWAFYGTRKQGAEKARGDRREDPGPEGPLFV